MTPVIIEQHATAPVMVKNIISRFLEKNRTEVGAISKQVVSTGIDGVITGASLTDDKSSMPLPVVKDKWLSMDEKRFDQLAKKEALETITPSERNELEELTFTRRKLHHARTAQEIIFEYQQRQITEDLFNALQRYVNFHLPKNHTGEAT